MKRLIVGLVAAVALVALPVATRAEQGGAKPQAKPAAPAAKTLTATGTVSAVSVDSLTVKGKTDSWTFTIDKTTEVRAKGATHKSLELTANGKDKKLTEFVKNGDTVTVSYHDMGATKHAAMIRVTDQKK